MKIIIYISQTMLVIWHVGAQIKYTKGVNIYKEWYLIECDQLLVKFYLKLKMNCWLLYLDRYSRFPLVSFNELGERVLKT